MFHITRWSQILLELNLSISVQYLLLTNQQDQAFLPDVIIYMNNQQS